MNVCTNERKKRIRCLTVMVAVSAVTTAALSARAQEPPPDELAAAFVAKVLASAVFVSHREVGEAVENSIVPFLRTSGLRLENLTNIDVNRAQNSVTITIKGTYTRTAKYFGDQGCIVIPADHDGVFFNPVKLESALPDPVGQPWPMGDKPDSDPLPSGLNVEGLNAALDIVFRPENHSAACVVVHKGRIVAERYGEGAGIYTRLESWSMGKSITAMLYGIVSGTERRFDPFIPAPIAQWKRDERAKIQIADLLRMSSGLRFSSITDPPDKWDHGHPDHIYIYSGGINVFDFSVSHPAEFAPNTVGRYRNCDPLLIGYIVKQAVETRGEQYLAFPQRALFDKIGIRNITLETDAWGNFIMTGFDYGTARDWARLGLLMMQDGTWLGTRILPEGFVDFVSSPAPAWRNSEYGGLFWLHRNGRENLPVDAYSMAGQGGQKVYIIPSHNLVVVRMGHQSGARTISKSLNEAFPLILASVASNN